MLVRDCTSEGHLLEDATSYIGTTPGVLRRDPVGGLREQDGSFKICKAEGR